MPPHLVVTSLAIHPIKAARGIAVTEARVERRGLQHDRRWMVVDGEGRFVTQRTHARMALVRVTIDADTLRIDAPQMRELRVPLAPTEGAHRSVVVWKSTCDALSAGDEAATWFGEYLGAPSDLVFMPDSTERAVNPDFARADDVASFADAYPILIATEESLRDLNARMEHALPMNRFRPNVVVAGAPAWDEDTWTRVAIGAIPLRVPKPCDRCVVTTVDQETAAKGVEPLRTLATFRAREGKVYFGQNAIPDRDGIVRVGDVVTIAERSTP